MLPDPATYPVGSTVTNSGANVYASSDPQAAPDFDANGVVVPGSYTESGVSGSTTTTISAVSLSKAEPSPESELLRGIHDHPTVYTLTVNATDAGASSGLVLVDYLPATLEFLGCGGVDNSSAREYAGAPSLTATPTPPNCLTPTSVSTVQNPPPNGTQTYPPGIYTRVEWTLGTIPAGGSIIVRYAAGIPLRANALWPGTPPSPTGLTQIANLDNNTGPSTRELASEASATNLASVQGTYEGPVAPGTPTAVLATASHTVSIEDVRMRKSVDPTTFTAGGRRDLHPDRRHLGVRQRRLHDHRRHPGGGLPAGWSGHQLRNRIAPGLRRAGRDRALGPLLLGDPELRRHVHGRLQLAVVAAQRHRDDHLQRRDAAHLSRRPACG